jgi:heat shock protein beta
VKDTAWILLDMATMSGGFPIRDPKKYASRMTRVLKSSLGVESIALAAEIDPPEEEDEPDEPNFDMPDMKGFNMGDMGDFDMEDLDM